MSEIVNKFLLSGDKLVPEMHLRQPGFIYSACGPSTKNKGRIKKKTYINFNKKKRKKVLNLKLMIMLEYQNINTFL